MSGSHVWWNLVYWRLLPIIKSVRQTRCWINQLLDNLGNIVYSLEMGIHNRGLEDWGDWINQCLINQM